MGDEGVTWEEATAGKTSRAKLLELCEWSYRLSNQGEDHGSGWNRAWIEMMPVVRQLLTEPTPSDEGRSQP